MRLTACLAIVVALGISSSVAGAANKTPARRAQEKAAQEACLLGDYQKGSELLVKLYVETHEPTYIYNQARCFEQNHRWEDAIDRFREYLRKATELPAGEKAEVDQHIAECQGHLNGAGPAAVPASSPAAVPAPPPAAMPAAAPPAAPPAPAESVPSPVAASAAPLLAAPPPPPPPAPEASLVIAPPAPEPVASRPVYTKWWFWTGVGAVVVAGVATAVVLSGSGGSGTSVPGTPLGNQPFFK